MIAIDRRGKLLATCLAGLAGYVDAVGYLASGGFFVSFMSGNSTRLAVGIVEEARFAWTATALVAAFVTGVTGGSLIGRRLGGWRQSGVMLFVALCLAGAAGGGATASLPLLMLVACAMGAENVVFEDKGDVRFGLTYMTGTLVKIGQRIAAALTGGDRRAWLPFLLLWAGLVTGAVLGAAAHGALGWQALWPAAGAAMLLAPGFALRR